MCSVTGSIGSPGRLADEVPLHLHACYNRYEVLRGLR